MLGGVKSRLAAVETAANPTSHTELDNVSGKYLFLLIEKPA